MQQLEEDALCIGSLPQGQMLFQDGSQVSADQGSGHARATQDLVGIICQVEAAVKLKPDVYRSTQGPKLLNAVTRWFLSPAPTASASSEEARDSVHASMASFPAATTTMKPLSKSFLMAESKRSTVAVVPIEMLTMAGVCPFSWIQSRPDRIVLMLPYPSQSITLTANNVTFLATPLVKPPARPATCVPWPEQSPPSGPASIASKPGLTLDVPLMPGYTLNSSWLPRMPVSTTYTLVPVPKFVAGRFHARHWMRRHCGRGALLWILSCWM